VFEYIEILIKINEAYFKSLLFFLKIYPLIYRGFFMGGME
jgi:hypothetical protein